MADQNTASQPGSFWQQLTDFLCLDEGHVGLIRRLNGIAFLPILGLIYYAIYHRYGPYCVPTWRFNDNFIELPLPPEPLSAALFLTVGICGVLLAIGKKHKLLVFLPTLFLIYFCSYERGTAPCHFIVMNFIYFVALCFHHPGKSPTRRIIQLAVSACYAFCILARLTSPTHLDGTTIRLMVGDGTAPNALFKPFFEWLYHVEWIWQPLTLLVIVLEVFLIFGFFLKKTRKAAFVGGVALHGGIALFLNHALAIFSFLMITGYLAFFDRPNASPESHQQQPAGTLHRLELVCAMVFIFLLFFIPSRVYFWPGRPIASLCTSDKDPWSFHMFIIYLRTDSVRAEYQDAEGVWHNVDLKGRMKFVSSDNELYKMISYIFSSYGDAQAVRIDVRLKLNDWIQRKVASANRSNPSRVVIQVEDIEAIESHS